MKVFKITQEQYNILKEYTKYSGNFVFETEEDDDFDPFGYDNDGNTKLMGNITNSCLLKFSKNNAKLGDTPYFSLPAGFSCPFAKECKSTADKETGKISDTKTTKFRCYAASVESLRTNVRKSRWHNYDLLLEAKTSDAMYKLIKDSITYHFPNGLRLLRIHESGDFFNQAYFDAWLRIAKETPNTIFYAYTKALNFWVNRLNDIPSNFKLNASKGGSRDQLIDQYGLKYVEVVFSPEEAKSKRLYIDQDDKLAWSQDKPFAILLHGIQPKGSDAATALSALRKRGFKGYSAK